MAIDTKLPFFLQTMSNPNLRDFYSSMFYDSTGKIIYSVLNIKFW